jgi:hypothetical protein
MTHGHTSSGSPSTWLLCLRDHSHPLQAQRASHLTTYSGKETPLWGTVRTSGALHRDIYIKKQWLVQAAKGHSQQIHLEIVSPLPGGDQAGAKIWASPNIKAPSYQGVDLRAARPYGERAD